MQNFLDAQSADRKRVLLIVDEAQSLTPAVLDDLRMLTNPQHGAQGMLQLVLVGQSGLRQLLHRPELTQALQRVTAQFHLQPLNLVETAEYIALRLRRAGCKSTFFTSVAIERIYHGSQGVPRLINTTCDSALMYGYAENLPLIDGEVVGQVLADHRSSNQSQLKPTTRLLAAPTDESSDWEQAEALFSRNHTKA